MNSVPYDFVDRVISRVPVPSTLKFSYLGNPWRKPAERVSTYELFVSNTHYLVTCYGDCAYRGRCEFQRCGLNFDLTSWNPRLCVIAQISLCQETAFGECFPLDNPTIERLKRIVKNNKRLIAVLERGLAEASFDKIANIMSVVPGFCDIRIESGRLNPLLVCQMLNRPTASLYVRNLAPEYMGAIADAIRNGLLEGCTIYNDSSTIDSTEYCRSVLDAIIERHAKIPPYELYANPSLYKIVAKSRGLINSHCKRRLNYRSRKLWS